MRMRRRGAEAHQVSRQRILIEVSIAADIQAVKGGGGVGVAGAMEAGLQRDVSYLETVAEYVFHFGEGIGPGRVVSYGECPLPQACAAQNMRVRCTRTACMSDRALWLPTAGVGMKSSTQNPNLSQDRDPK
jgi:hypothetical protein